MTPSVLEHMPLPVAMFRGSRHERVAASYTWQTLFALEIPAELRAHLALDMKLVVASELLASNGGSLDVISSRKGTGFAISLPAHSGRRSVRTST